MDDWKLLELAFDLLENAEEGEKTEKGTTYLDGEVIA